MSTNHFRYSFRRKPKEISKEPTHEPHKCVAQDKCPVNSAYTSKVLPSLKRRRGYVPRWGI